MGVLSLEGLPADATEKLLAWVPIETLLIASSASRSLREGISRSELLWSGLYDQKWPADYLPVPLQPPQGGTAMERFIHRSTAQSTELSLSCEAAGFTGYTVDQYNGNKTPASAFVRLRQSGDLEGIVSSGEGTIHNSPTHGVWAGKWTSCDEGWRLAWSEVLPTNRGSFVYEGVLLDDGTGVLRGTFHWSLMPRKGGSFVFTCARLPAHFQSAKLRIVEKA